METEIKMLSDIHKNADMGQDTLRHILDATKDAEFSKTVSRQMQEYEKAFQVSGQMLKARNAPEEQKEAPMISKWMAHMNINRKSMQTIPEKLEKLDQCMEKYQEIEAKSQPLSVKDLAVNGRDLIRAGIAPGPGLGQKLSQLLDLVLEEPELNTREQLLERIKE